MRYFILAYKNEIRTFWVILLDWVSNNPPDFFTISQTSAFQITKDHGKTVYQNSQAKK